MSFDRENYNKNQRVIGYVNPETKQKLVDAVDEGLAPSLSKLSSDIIEKNATDHIQKLRNPESDTDSDGD